MDANYTLADRIVQDSFAAVSAYSAMPYQEERQFHIAVNGGMALQVYAIKTHPELLRPTHDLDMTITPRLEPTTFRGEVGKSIADHLQDYNPTLRVGRHVYEINFGQHNGLDPFFIHLFKWTSAAYKRDQRTIEREIDNAATLTIPGTQAQVQVVRPEDIVAGKMRRLHGLNDKNALNLSNKTAYELAYDRDWSLIANYPLGMWREELITKKRQLPAFWDAGEDIFYEKANDYTASKDLFDITLIAKLATQRKLAFDGQYYGNILAEHPGEQ